MLKIVLEISVAFWLFALLHSYFATDRVKDWVFGNFPKLGVHYRWLYNVKSLVLFGLLLWFFPPKGELLYRFEPLWYWVARLGQGLLAICVYIAFRPMNGREFLGLPEKSARPQKLVTSGFFSISRHPLYFLISLILLLEPAMTVGKAAYIFNTILYFYIGTFIEERRLERLFGDVFREYRERVPRFFPRVRLCLSLYRSE